MGRRTLLLIASILVAALGTSLIWLYIQGADTRAQESSNLVSVLFLAQDAEAGADADALNLTQKDVSTAAAAGAVTNRAGLKGLKLTVRALTGQILLAKMVGNTTTSRFPQGGAVAISISDPNRVPADLAVGDTVDVYAFGGSGGKAREVVSGVRVRSIGNALAPTSGTATPGTATSVPVTIVGFDVDQATAKKLYDMVAAGEQPALYDHNPTPGTS
jgi:pilus assembly protein CpaB